VQKMMHVDPRRPFPRRFVPQDADMGEWSQIEPLFRELLARPVTSAVELERWLVDSSELTSVIAEERARRYIAMTQQTDDKAREAAYQHYVEHIDPRIKPLAQELKIKYLETPHRAQLDMDRYGVMDRNTDNDMKLFREQNIPLETQEVLLAKEYQKVTGAMTVTYQGQELTLQQAARYLDETDRAVRQEVWQLVTDRRLRDKDLLDDLYDQLLALRHQIATNAGFANYRDYAFKRRRRFDYTPEDCFRFHEGVEQAVMPLLHQIMTERRQRLGIDAVRPWDLQVDPQGRPPLRPFTDAGELVNGTVEIFTRVDPELGAQFKFMSEEQLLDLESRKGKAPGGYQSSLHERRWPFIFMNAVGRDDDIRTILHEGGHAFHMLAAREEPIIDYRHAPLEFAEVASMGMELLAAPHLNVFYTNPDDYARSRRNTLEDAVMVLPWVAIIDSFQHWIYTHPGHTRQERLDAWLAVHNRFSGAVHNGIPDWAGLEEAQAYRWQAQLHLYTVPFYYIEYGFAETGALQVWAASRRDHRATLERYWQALALGGSRPLPELFAAAGAKFQFDAETLKPLVDAVAEELNKLN
jgi:oligoendopeptidase F